MRTPLSTASPLRLAKKHQDVVARPEERRKVKGAAYDARKKATHRQLADATKTAKVDPRSTAQLAPFYDHGKQVKIRGNTTSPPKARRTPGRKYCTVGRPPPRNCGQ